MNNKKKQHSINREIRANEVRVVDVGVMSFYDALKLAESKEMDLVLVGASANPPVCKIMNYDKFLYEQGKKEKQKSPELKEIKVGPNTSENDLSYRIKHMVEFLEKGHRIKLTMKFKGREMAYLDKGMELILKLILTVKEVGVAESMPKLEGKQIIGFIKPITKK